MTLTEKAIQISDSHLLEVRAEARKHLPGFPSSGCATNLSVLLHQAGFEVPVITWAENLADYLKAHGWKTISKRQGQSGDVGVSIDGNGNQAADHIWFVISVNGDEMQVADNQADHPHQRSISGRDGKTATDYFLRPPVSPASAPPVTIDGKYSFEAGWTTRIGGELFIRARGLEEAGVAAVDYDAATGKTNIRVLPRP